MADYYTTAIINTPIPKRLLGLGSYKMAAIEAFGFNGKEDKIGGEDVVRFAADDYNAEPSAHEEDMSPEDFQKLKTILEAWDPEKIHGNELALEEHILVETLQDVIKASGDKLPYVEIEFAYTCSKLVPESHGGAAYFITADTWEVMGTQQWLSEKKAALAVKIHKEKRQS